LKPSRIVKFFAVCINAIRHGSTPSSEEQILNAVI